MFFFIAGLISISYYYLIVDLPQRIRKKGKSAENNT